MKMTTYMHYIANFPEGSNNHVPYSPAALELIEAALGHRPILSNFNTNIARPGSESMALHSDQSLTYPGPWNHTWVVNAVW